MAPLPPTPRHLEGGDIKPLDYNRAGKGRSSRNGIDQPSKDPGSSLGCRQLHIAGDTLSEIDLSICLISVRQAALLFGSKMRHTSDLFNPIEKILKQGLR
jgi:hypothetical protein